MKRWATRQRPIRSDSAPQRSAKTRPNLRRRSQLLRPARPEVLRRDRLGSLKPHAKKRGCVSGFNLLAGFMPFWNNLGGTIRLKGIEIYPILVAINAAKFSFGAILELKNGEK